MYCPLLSNKQCVEEKCVWWSEEYNNCLIRLSMLQYIQDPTKELKNETDKLKAQITMSRIGFPPSNYIDTGGL